MSRNEEHSELRTRISKVRFRDGRELVVLPSNDIDGDPTFIYTLVSMLRSARQGRVHGYVGGFLLETDDGDIRMIEFGDFEDPVDGLSLLGLLEGVRYRLLLKVKANAPDVAFQP